MALYIATIITLSGFYIAGKSTALSLPLLFCAAYQWLKFFLVKYGTLCIRYEKERGKLSLKTFIIASSIPFVIFTLSLFARYPGGISPDNVSQWIQVQSGNFNNWHSSIHTMMIWLVTRIVPNYSFFLGFQILLFSILVGYMYANFRLGV